MCSPGWRALGPVSGADIARWLGLGCDQVVWTGVSSEVAKMLISQAVGLQRETGHKRDLVKFWASWRKQNVQSLIPWSIKIMFVPEQFLAAIWVVRSWRGYHGTWSKGSDNIFFPFFQWKWIKKKFKCFSQYHIMYNNDVFIFNAVFAILQKSCGNQSKVK